MPQGYEEVVRGIYRLQKFRGKISLGPIEEVMEKLNHPEKDFPAVHVAGTNGKGSTATLLARVLEEDGLKTGLFTSPHLVDFRERVRVNGEKISREEVVSSYEEVSSLDVDMSFFECMTAMAFEHFSQEDIDIAVVETGMGGRVDATNVVEPGLSVITNVAEEHTKWLGETPEQIAYELAGIIKEGAPAVSGVEGRPGNVVGSVAEEEGVDLVPTGRKAHPVPDETLTLTLEWAGEHIDTEMVGRYQVENVNTALTACEALDRDVSREAVVAALQEVDMPGRMEPVSMEPLVLLDGAHNPAAVQQLPSTLSELDVGKTIAVVSIMADKDYERMLSTVADFVDLVILSEAGIDRAADPEVLESCIGSVDREVVRSIPDAVDTALGVAGRDDLVLVTGSLYFVGDVKKVLGRPQVSPSRT